MARRRGSQNTDDTGLGPPDATPGIDAKRRFSYQFVAAGCLRLGQLDPCSLACSRRALSAVVIFDVWEKLWLVPAFYENARSTYPRFALEEDAGLVARLNAFTAFDGNDWPRALLVLTAVASLGMARWRCCSVVTWLLVAMVVLRNVHASFIFDRYLLVALLFSSCLPYGQVSGTGWSAAVVLLRAQLAWIYIDAGYGKVADERGDWSLHAVVPALAVYLRAPVFRPLQRLDALLGGQPLRVAGAMAAWAELAVGPAMIVSAALGGWVQVVPVIMVLLLHAGIGASMEGGFAIALVAMATWAALLPGTTWQVLGCRVRPAGGPHLDAPAHGWAAGLFLAGCIAFGLSGAESSPGPVPTVLLLNRWRVFTGADTTLNWEVAPARLANGSTVDLWSWHPVSFLAPHYGRRGRWMSFPTTRPGSDAALQARFQYLCDEWNAVHEVKVVKYQLFELFADLGPDLELHLPQYGG